MQLFGFLIRIPCNPELEAPRLIGGTDNLAIVNPLIATEREIGTIFFVRI